jgi:hypothetical protein
MNLIQYIFDPQITQIYADNSKSSLIAIFPGRRCFGFILRKSAKSADNMKLIQYIFDPQIT